MEVNKIINGDALQVLKTFSSESIDCCISSPPYWALRDYGESVKSIFDEDSDCEHNWQNITYRIGNQAGNEDKETNQWFTERNNFSEQFKATNPTTQFCSKCNAWKGQLGLEPDFNLYIKHLCDIYNEIKRVLKKSGTCFVNLSDTYYGGGNNRGSPEENLSEKQFSNRGARGQVQIDWDNSYSTKCLCLIPHRFVIEMVNRGWILRNDLIWYKRNSMPCSVNDRWANKYEHVFFFVKKKKYYFDLDSIRKPYGISSIDRINAGFSDRVSFDYRVREACKGTLQTTFGEKYSATEREKENYDDKYGSIPLNKIYSVGACMKRQKYNEKYNQLNDKAFQRKELGISHDLANCNPKGGNPGDLLDINIKGHPFAHFAVYPETLVEPLIKSGCPEFVCNKCGKPRERIIEKKLIVEREFNDTGKAKEVLEANDKRMVLPRTRTGIEGHNEYKQVGWKECSCDEGFSGGIVLDPFMGSGTTAIVTLKLNRKFLGIELSKEYIKIAEQRIKPYLEQKTLSEVIKHE